MLSSNKSSVKMLSWLDYSYFCLNMTSFSFRIPALVLQQVTLQSSQSKVFLLRKSWIMPIDQQ